MYKKTAFNYEKTIQAIANGKQSALLDLYEYESSAMMSLAYTRLNDLSFANKAIENTFKTLYIQAELYDPRMGNAKGWLYSLLNYYIQDIYQKNEALIPQREESPILNIHPLENDFEFDDSKQEEFIHLFQQLSTQQQSYLFNLYMSPKTQVEIATDFNLGIAHFREALHEILSHFIEHIELFKAVPYQVKIAEYSLGGLTENQSKEVIDLLNEPQHLMTFLEWESYFQSFIHYLPKKHKPSSFVIDYIKDFINQVQKEKQPDTTPRSEQSEEKNLTSDSKIRLGLSHIKRYGHYILMALLILLSLLIFLSEPYRQNKINMVATLIDSQAEPHWIVELRQQNLKINPLKNIEIPKNHELQVWVEPADTQKAYILINRMSQAQTQTLSLKNLTSFNAWDKISIFLAPSPESGQENKRPEGTRLYQGYWLPLE